MIASLKAKILFPNVPEPLWYDVPEEFGKISVGALVEAPVLSRAKLGILIELSNETFNFNLKPLLSNLEGQFKAHQQWISLLEWISQYYHCALSRVLFAAFPKEIQKLVVNPKTPKETSDPKEKPEPLALETPNPEQKKAIASIKECLKQNPAKFQSFLLHGITGSGKTLIYLKSAQSCLNKNRCVLFLLPEIALTVQLIDRIQTHLDKPVYTYHSNMSAKEKKNFWFALRSKKTAVFVGVRSMILLPFTNIGLIIVDEEHDGSYKQTDSFPRYNARDVALYRARQSGACSILGSATPSLESYYLAQKHKHQLLVLSKRATNSKLPEIKLINMREQMELQGESPLSIPLREALAECMENKEQAILLLNRRGLAKKRLCKSCGHIQICKNCINPLIPHKQHQRLLCHCCGYSLPLNSKCISCGSGNVANVGVAIEKFEEQLTLLFPTANILRLDRDSVSRVGAAEKILSQFRNGDADILLGTQMVAKGHDFPMVNLVGVIDVDSGLGIPDFRAQEKIFQLVTQVSGRAGRHSHRGQVFLQTYNPENPVLQFALNQDFEEFYKSEIKMREELFYPPWSRIFKVEFSGKKPQQVKEAIQIFGNHLKAAAKTFPLQIMGPGEAVFARQKDMYRWQIFGKARQFSQIKQVLEVTMKNVQGKIPKTVHHSVDMDPIHLL